MGKRERKIGPKENGREVGREGEGGAKGEREREGDKMWGAEKKEREGVG